MLRAFLAVGDTGLKQALVHELLTFVRGHRLDLVQAMAGDPSTADAGTRDYWLWQLAATPPAASTGSAEIFGGCCDAVAALEFAPTGRSAARFSGPAFLKCALGAKNQAAVDWHLAREARRPWTPEEAAVVSRWTRSHDTAGDTAGESV